MSTATAEVLTFLSLAVSFAAIVRLVIECRREYAKAQVQRQVRIARLVAMANRKSF